VLLLVSGGKRLETRSTCAHRAEAAAAAAADDDDIANSDAFDAHWTLSRRLEEEVDED